MSDATLQLLAYFVICLSVIGYTVLDGFDLGVGALHLFARNDRDRRIFFNAIGPLWDGNEVWLIIIGGGLFVAFPRMYATLFSVFYTPVMILLCGIIFRAVAIEFRSKVESPKWRSTWDVLFFISSMVIIFCVGVMIGNLIEGVPIGKDGAFNSCFWCFFGIYPICVGLMAMGLFALHGLAFLLMKTEGQLHDNLRKLMPYTMVFFVIFYMIVSLMTLHYSSHMMEKMVHHPSLMLIPLLTLLLIVAAPFLILTKRDFYAFIATSLVIIGLFSLFGIGTFPTLLRSSIDPEAYSITYTNAAASRSTLEVFLTIVVIGIPLVLAYSVWIYHIFRGKVKLTKSSY